mgnify:FL=1
MVSQAKIITKHYYTKQEVEYLIAAAITKHNRTASIISILLGVLFLAAFVDGFLRTVGMIPPFLDIDVNIIQDIIEKAKEI